MSQTRTVLASIPKYETRAGLTHFARFLRHGLISEFISADMSKTQESGSVPLSTLSIFKKKVQGKNFSFIQRIEKKEMFDKAE